MTALIQHLRNSKSSLLLGGLLLLPSLFTSGASVSVWVTIEPQAHFVQAVGGDAVKCARWYDGHCVELYAPSPRDGALSGGGIF